MQNLKKTIRNRYNQILIPAINHVKIKRERRNIHMIENVRLKEGSVSCQPVGVVRGLGYSAESRPKA